MEPGKPAWKDIVAYFGKQVLAEDERLDRAKLREIVFKDLRKEERNLKVFSTPEYLKNSSNWLSSIPAEDPNAIIQVVVPLLIEANMHPLFHQHLDGLCLRRRTKKASEWNVTAQLKRWP